MPDNQPTDENLFPDLFVTHEICSLGHTVMLRWKNRHPTYREVREMAEILSCEADRLMAHYRAR
jgi:hypothetical protein